MKAQDFRHNEAMPRLQYNGELYPISEENAAELREKLDVLRNTDSLSLEISDVDGDKAWLYIPYGAPLSIRYFD